MNTATRLFYHLAVLKEINSVYPDEKKHAPVLRHSLRSGRPFYQQAEEMRSVIADDVSESNFHFVLISVRNACNLNFLS